MRRFLLVVFFISVTVLSYAQLKVPSNLETEDIEGERLVAGEGEKKIITSAYGETSDKAMENALRNAVEEAVGALISSETKIENDEIVKDEVLSYSKGFIKTYKKLSEEKDDGDFKVTVAAIITQKQLIEKLEATGVEVAYQTSGMFAQLQAWDKAKEDEFSLAKKIFSVDPLKPFPIAYNFQVNVGEPVRKGEYYFINTKVIASPNPNYISIIQNTKAMLNELAYEVKEFAYFIDLSHNRSANSQSKMTYSAWVNVQKTIEIKRNGKEKINKDYQFLHCNFPEFKPRLMSGTYDMLNRHGNQRLEFLGNLDYELLGMLSKRSYEKPLSQEDKNRLNDRSLQTDRVNLVYDVFSKNYTPYLFIIREPKKITVYKFINPATIDVIGRYFTFLLEGLHVKTVFDMNGIDDIEVVNPVYHQCMYSYSSGIKTTTPEISNLYTGMVLESNPAVITVDEEHKFKSDDFSRIANIAVKPTYDGYTFFETKP
ncbi:hypothetical protein ACE01N_02395 [Saccharicrinis sp. FJH2]|uniref:hypothetical protein n=1 Tax=Saccharicrinis sp. FJH65 TaxID=3344659 RepID=UPI0035F4984D